MKCFSFVVQLLLLLLLFTATNSLNLPANCDIREIFLINKCYPEEEQKIVPKLHSAAKLYIIYDVNPVEGFNLRRDVYIRMATFLYSLRGIKKWKNARLVLPPFTNMYHWRSRHLEQERVFWTHFFDMAALREFTDVMDFPEFLAEIRGKKVVIDEVYRLQSYDDMFENGVFVDKFERSPCKNFRESDFAYWGYTNITGRTFSCVNFQGGAKLLRKMLYKYRTMHDDDTDRIVLILNTETVLHDFWGTKVYWEARRSMRFSKALTQLAAHFCHDFLATTVIQRPKSWRQEEPSRASHGGPYIAAHLRRADFLYGREKTTPSLLSAATQLKRKLRELNLTTVFLASDCTGHEFLEFKNLIRPFRLVKFTTETREQLHVLKDGGVAIIDQIIASQAQFFIGTYESTFTFRIYEEREILGFPQATTYNTFCKRDDGVACEKNSVWTIMY